MNTTCFWVLGILIIIFMAIGEIKQKKENKKKASKNSNF
jgi:hypothetical protein